MIKEFQNEFRFLSNFFPCRIDWEGITYPSVEHAYQASKTLDQKERRQIANLPTPGKAKRAGQKLEIRPDWEEVKISVMESLVRQKFTRHPLLKRLLLATGNQEIQEGNTWNDTFWGVSLSTGEGRNELGKILMRVRRELRISVKSGANARSNKQLLAKKW